MEIAPGADVAMVINPDLELAKRNMTSRELVQEIGPSEANLNLVKVGKGQWISLWRARDDLKMS